MIGYTMVGTANIERAIAFYSPLFEAMGLKPCYHDLQVASWGDPNDDTVARFFVCYPFDGDAASVGNGAMTTFRVASATLVARLYQSALERGATNEGAPGFRPERYGDKFYVAYVRDPDGNKIAFACYDGKANP
ncbi:MAG: VOC family protein [Pseudomonadota bacterium]